MGLGGWILAVSLTALGILLFAIAKAVPDWSFLYLYGSVSIAGGVGLGCAEGTGSASLAVLVTLGLLVALIAFVYFNVFGLRGYV